MKTKQKIRSTLTLPELIIRGLKSDKETFVSTFSLSQCHLCVCVCVLWLENLHSVHVHVWTYTEAQVCIWLCRNMRDTLKQPWLSQIM